MSNAVHRRDLLRAAAALAPAVVAGRAFAAPAAGKTRLLVVFLRGAYDAAAVVVPTGSAFYYASRPTIALAPPDPANPDATSALDGDWGLHPALAESILPLWRARQIAFVPFAGTDDLSRSHFGTQDTIELGQPIGRARNLQSGFMARLAGVLGADPIAFTDQLPLCFRGGVTVPNLSPVDGCRSGIDARHAQMIAAMYRGVEVGGTDLAQSVADGFEVRSSVCRSLAEADAQVDRAAVSAKGFALAAPRIATLMRDRFNLAFVDVGGWDTHVRQGGAQGQLAERIGELGRGLAGFAEAIGPQAWAETTVVVISEFGRTFRENGDKGTDHGHGSIYWVLGGAVRGGRIAGPQVRLAEATLNEGRDLPVLTDYRALIGGIAGRLYGLDARALDTVFPSVRATDLQLV